MDEIEELLRSMGASVSKCDETGIAFSHDGEAAIITSEEGEDGEMLLIGEVLAE